MKKEIISLKVKNKIFLAPMEEVNDIAFRLVCKKAGAGLTFTPLTSPLYTKKLFLKDKPILQIFANKTEGISKFMKKYDKKVSGWDLNLGCPSKNARKRKFGAYINNLETIEKILKIMRENTKKPLLVKIRKSKIAFKTLAIAEKYCDAISIHPRTKEQGYSGNPDLKWAKVFKKKSKIPVIYSGNVNLKNYSNLLKEFDYVMIGRNAIGHPEIFSQINNKKFKRNFKLYLKYAKKYNVPWKNIKFQAMQFTKGLKNSRKLRPTILKSNSLKELLEILN
jgi:tRNA-dihydrouridine synthase